jgi:uncharacterized protein (TIGR03435 family)
MGRVSLRTFCLSATVLAVPLFTVHESRAQRTAGQQPRQFEVSSIRPNRTSLDELIRSDASFGIRIQSDRLIGSWVSLRTLIAHAYDLKDYQLAGGPDWLPSARFDVNAKASGSATAAEMREMLRTLLAERFGLRLHVETRQMTVETLAPARSDGRLGPGLTLTSAECQALLDAVARGTPLPGIPERRSDDDPVCGYMLPAISARTGAAIFTAGGIPMSTLAEWISDELKSPIVDRTGLSGNFDVVFEYESPRAVAAAKLGADRETTAPQLRDALRSKLGLRLERGTAPVSITVVDAADMPMPD